MTDDTTEDEGMSFLEHLDELRRRLFWCIGIILVLVTACYPVSAKIAEFLQRPLRAVDPDVVLRFRTLGEPFRVHIMVALLTAVLLASPFIFTQLWLFVAPGLYRNEKRYVIPFVLAATASLGAGAYFAFEIVAPRICGFLIAQGELYEFDVELGVYFSFICWFVLGVAATFELPVITALLARLGILTPGFLLHNFHFAIVGCMIVAALITPSPDPLNMMLVAVPMILLYGLSILIAKLVAPTDPLEPRHGRTSDPGAD